MNKQQAIEILRQLHDAAVQKGLYNNAASVIQVTKAIEFLENLQTVSG